MFPGKQTSEVADNPEPPAKRQKKDNPVHPGSLISLNREISPPPPHRGSSSNRACSILTRGIAKSDALAEPHSVGKKGTGGGKSQPTNPPNFIDLTRDEEPEPPGAATNQKFKQKQPRPRLTPPEKLARAFPSPFQLTSIRDLPASENVDTVGIKDILGDVMIKEAWIFNFLIDLDWVMNQFDPDIRDIVDVKIVHGSWRKEDSNRVRLEEQSQRYPNTKIICAYMPEPFGTHHTKMIVLFRHDDLAQVIIHTSNMIAFDWTNMTQAAWRSPLLPLISTHDRSSQTVSITGSGVGDTFKNDLLTYFAKYGSSRTGGLTQGLRKFSFADVKAVFIGSVPGNVQVDGRGKGEMWGWMALKRIMGKIPLRKVSQDQGQDNRGKIVAQVSSIATLGQRDVWLSPVFYKALSASRNEQMSKPKQPKLSIIFPTVEEVRDSLNGYNSGTAIHIKIQSKAQQKQLGYLRPFLCHWDSFSPPKAFDQSSPSSVAENLSGRSRAAPHIKTYIRFTDETCTEIDWAMLTSANLSTQAWGGGFGNSSGRLMGRGEGEVKISSYEAGVVIYPELFKDDGEDVTMVPVFKKDMPNVDRLARGKIIGLRMPYGLPIKAYEKDDLPWCATMSYGVLDCMGRNWEGS